MTMTIIYNKNDDDVEEDDEEKDENDKERLSSKMF